MCPHDAERRQFLCQLVATGLAADALIRMCWQWQSHPSSDYTRKPFSPFSRIFFSLFPFYFLFIFLLSFLFDLFLYFLLILLIYSLFIFYLYLRSTNISEYITHDPPYRIFLPYLLRLPGHFLLWSNNNLWSSKCVSVVWKNLKIRFQGELTPSRWYLLHMKTKNC